MMQFQSRHSPDDMRQASRVAAFTGVLLFWALVFVPVYMALGSMACANILLLGAVVGLGNLICIERGVSTRICGNILCGVAFYVYTGLAMLNGGVNAPVVIWYVTIPVVSLVACTTRWACFWTVAAVSAIVTFSVLDFQDIALPTAIGPTESKILHLLGLIGLVLCFFVLAYVMVRFEKYSRDVLCEANRWLELESTSDSLTNIANRRCFDRVFEQEWKRHRRERVPLSVALIDLDYFKEFNDLRGHLAGDNVLRLVAAAIQAGVHRRDDVVARFGGEEFVVVLPNTPSAHLPVIMDNIRDQIRELNIQHPRSPIGDWVTISIGAATVIPTDDRSHYDLLREADEALYRAKAAGRDRVAYAREPEGLATPESSTVPFDGRTTRTEITLPADSRLRSPVPGERLTDVGA